MKVCPAIVSVPDRGAPLVHLDRVADGPSLNPPGPRCNRHPVEALARSPRASAVVSTNLPSRLDAPKRLILGAIVYAQPEAA